MKYQGFIWAGLWVQDLEACIAFYRDGLGLPLLGQDQDWAQFEVADGAMLELMSGGKASQMPKKPDQQSIILGLRVADLDDAIVELKSKGVVFLGDIGEHGKTRWVPFSDPEGNQLEIKEVPPVNS